MDVQVPILVPIDAIYQLGRKHSHRETELLHANNRYQQEARDARARTKMLEALIRRMRVKLTSAETSLKGHCSDDGFGIAMIAEAKEISDKVGEPTLYAHMEVVEPFAARIIEVLRPDLPDTPEGRHELPILVEHLSLFLRDEVGV